MTVTGTGKASNLPSEQLSSLTTQAPIAWMPLPWDCMGYGLVHISNKSRSRWQMWVGTAALWIDRRAARSEPAARTNLPPVMKQSEVSDTNAQLRVNNIQPSSKTNTPTGIRNDFWKSSEEGTLQADPTAIETRIRCRH